MIRVVSISKLFVGLCVVRVILRPNDVVSPPNQVLYSHILWILKCKIVYLCR